VAAERLVREVDTTLSGYKAVIHFARLAARLKAAPFQNNAKRTLSAACEKPRLFKVGIFLRTCLVAMGWLRVNISFQF
jgi:hypothetical protein